MAEIIHLKSKRAPGLSASAAELRWPSIGCASWLGKAEQAARSGAQQISSSAKPRMLGGRHCVKSVLRFHCWAQRYNHTQN